MAPQWLLNYYESCDRARAIKRAREEREAAERAEVERRLALVEWPTWLEDESEE